MNEFENAVKNDLTAAEYYGQFDCPALRRLLLNRIGVKGLMLEDFSPTGKVSVLHPLVSVAMPEIQNNPAWKDIAESVNPAEQWHQYLRILQQIALLIKKDIAKELEQASLMHVVPDEEGLPVFLVSEPEYIDGIDAGADFLYDDFRSNLRGETEPNFDTERELYDFLRTEAVDVLPTLKDRDSYQLPRFAWATLGGFLLLISNEIHFTSSTDTSCPDIIICLDILRLDDYSSSLQHI